ncbi:Hypothetical protein I595_3419 [Croceitalea dokdonensis DOKDO 023]|uniref:Uncharacterized protein n=1 Tax=Croceitalea dokdonensis DOKDO 023 TaxID=1300341 RepID=A0A0N8H3H6_9FLAO|nr:Hypothetical protein I595_3419 [Croceitalea dokdonensis DOKDO 023]
METVSMIFYIFFKKNVTLSFLSCPTVNFNFFLTIPQLITFSQQFNVQKLPLWYLVNKTIHIVIGIISFYHHEKPPTPLPKTM